MAQPAQLQPTPTGIRLGRYETLFRIAAGGMAEVHVARLVGEGGFEKLVALKRMLPNLAADERFVGMFLDEAKVAANISSPHVVATLDLGRADDDSLYLVMELVVGVSLSALCSALKRQNVAMPVDLGAEIIAQAALGLHDAHEARTVYGEWLGIVHRDVSPQNVLVDVSGRVRITDFGVARAIERVTQTESGEVKGKLAYFAPEQARAKPLDRRADVFALGIVAWELFTGQRLFAGDGPAETVMRVLEMPVPRLDEIRPDVPAALADAIARALDRDVHTRTETAGVFAQEIRAAMPSAGSARVGELVRERGGESLHRLETGIRSQTPSSPGRVSSPSKASRLAPVSVPVEEEALLESHSGVVSSPNTTGPREVSAAAAAPTVRLARPETPSVTRRWIPAVAVLVLLAVLGIGVWLGQSRGGAPEASMIAVPLRPVEALAPPPPSTLAISTAAPPSVTPPAPSTTATTKIAPTGHRPRRDVGSVDTVDPAPARPLDTRPSVVAPPAPVPSTSVAVEAPQRAPGRETPTPTRHGTSALRDMADFESEL